MAASPTSQVKAPFHVPQVTRGQALLILGAGAFLLSIAMGVRQSYGLFQTPVVRELGIATSQFAFAIALQNLTWGLAGPFAGAAIDRFGTRWMAVGGVLLFISGLAMTAMATNAAMIMLGSGIMIGLSQTCTTFAVAAKMSAMVVSPSYRSLAFGILSAAGSVGTFFIAPLGQIVIGEGGWRMGIVAFIALGLCALPAAFIGGRADALRDAPGRGVGQSLTAALSEAAAHKGFIVMSLAYFVCGLQLTFLTTHLPSYLALCGMDPMLGAQALAVVGLFNVFGSWLFGWLGDKHRKRNLLGMIYVARSIIVAIYFVTPVSPASTLVFAALMGLLWLGVIPLINGIVADIFGIKYMSTLMGIAFLSHQVGSFLGAWGGGFIYDMLGSYDRAVLFCVITGAIAGCAQLLMDDRPTQRMTKANAVPAE